MKHLYTHINDILLPFPQSRRPLAEVALKLPTVDVPKQRLPRLDLAMKKLRHLPSSEEIRVLSSNSGVTDTEVACSVYYQRSGGYIVQAIVPTVVSLHYCMCNVSKIEKLSLDDCC